MLQRSDFKTRKEYRWAVKQEAHATKAPVGTRRLWAQTKRKAERLKEPREPTAFQQKVNASRERMEAKTAARNARTAEMRANKVTIWKAIAEGRAKARAKKEARDTARAR